MARRRKRRKSTTTTRRRRRRNPSALMTRSNPRRRSRRRNPGHSPTGLVKTAVSTMVPATIAGAVVGYADSKWLAGRSPLIRIGAKVGLAAASGFVFRRKPQTSAAIMGAILGTVGHDIGVRAAGGFIAANARAGVAELSALASDDEEALSALYDEMSGMGLLENRDPDGVSLGAMSDDIPDLGAGDDDEALAELGDEEDAA